VTSEPDPAVRTERAPRLDAITGLRWWAAFAVFGFHMMAFAPLRPSIVHILTFGDYGVAFFFVLSGFVLTWSMRSGLPRRTFYWRRFARIYPLHFLTLLLAIPVFYSVTPAASDWWVKPLDLGVLLLSVLLIQGWWRDSTILFSGNPAAWTLTVEAFFYALHPFLARPLAKLTRAGALWGAGATAVFAVAQRTVIHLDPGGWFALLPWPVLRVNEFILGMLLAWAFRQGWRPRLHPLVPTAGIVVYFAALLVMERASEAGIAGAKPAHTVISTYTPAAMMVLFGLLIVSTSSRELSGGARLMRWRPLVILGEWSFAFYLIHATIIYTALTIFGKQPARWLNLGWFAVLLLVAIAAAGALHVWIERPVESRLRAWEQRRRSRRELAAAEV
jgi:peptidoglycan/LPS O-acetylase OafA/YrhL